MSVPVLPPSLVPGLRAGRRGPGGVAVGQRRPARLGMAHADQDGGERGRAQATEPANDGDEPHISLPLFGSRQGGGGQEMAGAVEDDQV
jgi:hypothetical protein